MTPTATPAEVWNEMRQGNARFVSGDPSHPRQDVERRHELASPRRSSSIRALATSSSSETPDK